MHKAVRILIPRAPQAYHLPALPGPTASPFPTPLPHRQVIILTRDTNRMLGWRLCQQVCQQRRGRSDGHVGG